MSNIDSIQMKILVVEHNPNNIDNITQALKTGGIDFILEIAENEIQYRNTLQNFIPDIILSGYILDSINGQMAFKIRDDVATETPFIIVSESIGEENSVEYIKKGVTDYVLKDRLITLAGKVKRALTDVKEKQKQSKTNNQSCQAFIDLKKIMNASLDVICAINYEGKFVNISPTSENIFGFTPEELKGKHYKDFVCFEDVELTEHVYTNTINSKSVTSFENRYIRKDGSLVPILWSAAWDAEDKLMYCIAKDATEKKRLEKNFENDKERFYDLFLNAPSCMGFLSGPNHIFEMANPLYLELIGKKDIVGKTVAEVLPEVVEQGFIEILDNVYNSGKTFYANEIRVQLKKENNEKFADKYLNIIYQAYRNAESKVEGIFFFFNDVTEQVESRKKIEESENHFRALVEHGTDGVIILSATGKFNYVSPSIERLLGYTEEEAMKLEMFSLFHPDQLTGTAEVWQRVMDNPGVPVPGHPIRILHKNGTWRWFEATITNMLHDPSVNGIVDNYRDVTERIKAEQQREFDQNNLNALINNTQDLMWSVDRNFKLITSNKPFDDTIILMSGRSISKGDDVLELDFSIKQTVHFKRIYERAFEGKTFKEIIYSDIPAETWAEISYCPIYNGSEVIGVACHSRDITQLKINERTIVDERILLRTLIDNLPAIIYAKDVYSKKTLANRADYQNLGANNEAEVLGKDDSYFFSKEVAWNTALEEQQIFYSGKPIINKEEHLKKKDGTVNWYINSKIPLRNQQQEIVGLVGISQDITERKKIEQQLKKSELFNRGVINALTSQIAVINAAGNIVAVNETWEQFGMQNGATFLEGTSVGSNYFEVCQKAASTGVEKALIVLQGMKDVMNEKIYSFNTEYPCHSPEEQRWFSLRVTKFESEDAQIVVSHQDITERKLAEEAMSLTQFAVDNAGDAIFWMKPDSRIVAVNKAACYLLNYSREEILSLSVPDIDPYYNPERWSVQFEELRKKKSLFFETVQRTKDGRLIPVEIRTTYIKFDDKELNCAFVRDITERRKAEENLLKSESRLLEAQAIAHVGNWEIDLETAQHTWSDEYYNILGITKEEANPSFEYYLSFVHFEDLDRVKKIIEENYKTLDPVPYDFRFVRKDGVIRFGYAQSRFEFDNDHNPIRLFGVIQDVTESKLSELKLEQQNIELTKINFELDRFVYSVSHELRAPLTSVSGLVSFIEDESKEADILKYAGMIRTSVDRLDNIINNILSYSRNKRTNPEVKEIPVLKTVNEIVSSLSHIKEAEGIKFEVIIQEDVPFFSDLRSFKTIVENLVSNAIKFQKDESVCRCVKITGHINKDNLNLYIEDNGIGIPSKYHDDIFRMFFRLSGKTGGSGIGLYIVKEMIDKLQGSIKFKSTEGIGTAFKIQLKNLETINSTK